MFYFRRFNEMRDLVAWMNDEPITAEQVVQIVHNTGDDCFFLVYYELK